MRTGLRFALRALPPASLAALSLACDSFADRPRDDDLFGNPRPPMEPPRSPGSGGFAGGFGAGGAGGTFPVGTGGFFVTGGRPSTGGAATGTGGLSPEDDLTAAIEPLAHNLDLESQVTAAPLAGAGVDEILAMPDGGVIVAGEDFIDDRPGLSLVRVGPDGTTVWARWMETSAGRSAGGMLRDAEGHLLLAGTFAGVLDVDGQRIESLDPPSPDRDLPSTDAFLMRVDVADGSVLALSRLGGVGQQAARALLPQPGGGAVLVAEFSGRIACGDFELTSTLGALGSNIMLCRLDEAGAPVAARALAADAWIWAAAVDGSGNVVLAGITPHWAMPAALELGPAWVLSVDGDAAIRWARRIDETGRVNPTALAIDGNDDVLLASRTISSSPATVFGEPFGEHGIALSRLATDDGSVAWTKLYGVNVDSIDAIAVFPDGAIAVAGGFRDVIDFGGGEHRAANPTFGRDVFIAGLEADGGFRFSLSAGSRSSDAATAATVDAGERLVVAGWVGGAIHLGSDPMETPHGAFVTWVTPAPSP